MPPPTYIKGEEEEAGPRGGAPRGSPTWTPSPSRIRPPSFLPPEREKGKGERGRRKEGGRTPPLVQFGLGKGGAPLTWPFSSPPIRPNGPNTSPGGSSNSRFSVKLPESLGTIPMSKCNLPIYESLPLDHFETPRHVRDLIRDSEQTSVTKTHNS